MVGKRKYFQLFTTEVHLKLNYVAKGLNMHLFLERVANLLWFMAG